MRKALRSLPFLQAGSTFGYEPLTKNQDNNSTKKSVTVYPNPVDGDILNVKIEGDDFRKTNSNYEFFDINNNKISSGKFDKLISTQNLKGGNYVLKLNIGGEIITKKIIINHKNK